MRSSGRHSWISARMKVVLPTPCPPATSTFRRARTSAVNSDARPSSYMPRADQVLLIGVDEEMPADRDVRALRHPRRRCEAGAIGELKVEDRPGRRELALHVSAPPSEGLDLLDQFAVGARNRVAELCSTVDRAQAGRRRSR